MLSRPVYLQMETDLQTAVGLLMGATYEGLQANLNVLKRQLRRRQNHKTEPGFRRI